MASKKTKEPPKTPKRPICVRMPQKLYDAVVAESESGDRTPPAQIRRILKRHYGFDEDDE